MSVKVMGLVWDTDLPRDEKFILLAYADHADHDGGNIYPSIATIARKTGYSERSVQAITRKLEQIGTMRLDGKGIHGTRRYTIVIVNGCVYTGAKIAPVQKTAERGEENAPLGVQPTAPKPSFNRQEPSTAQAPKVGNKKIEFRDPMWDLQHGKQPEDLSPEEVERRKLADACELFAFAPEYHHLLKAFIQATGIFPVKSVVKGWHTALKTLLEQGITSQDIFTAVRKMRQDGLTIKDPFSVQGNAVDVHAIRTAPKPSHEKSDYENRLETGNYGMTPEEFRKKFPAMAERLTI
jgi:biotin operon repressor